MRTKILQNLTVLFLTLSWLTTYANSDSPLNQQTLDRLRESYDLEAPSTQDTAPYMPDRWSQGDWGVSLDSSSLTELLHASLQPVFYIARQLIYMLSS
ncbi:hypothetical protein ACQKLN_03545 [Paenibacillus glucanolyticus]|uniref:hypothetical protein n=1 Tax=Paenibacillus glucanolyticus TaxID=59843 RepID=UPI000EA9F632|nr:hypothetical protein D6D84_03525 [Moraxella catarrhalis]